MTHCLIECKLATRSEVAQLCLTLCDPMDSQGILQALGSQSIRHD